ncbi:MAG: TonB-dependent receptor [Candidatus Didemnitutus sp.]|nr:TonB-dependent receptor [Candidatus Didemnitutus sp.]
MAVALLATAFVTPVNAQEATGGVAGRVQNFISGNALNLARVTVAGSNREFFTNDYGDYRIANLPAGEVTLNFSFTGLETKSVKVTIVAGQTVTQDMNLSSSFTPAASQDSDVVTLDAFQVTSQRETDAGNIASNEERYSANLKNVVSSDAFGDVTEGNVGEFMKFLPGVSVDYVAADVRTMSVRGFADNFTAVSIDGARVASSSSGASSRAFEFEQVSINNVSRVEVSKVPTPSMPADSLGGSVNMVSKNAFERKGTQFKYRAYLNASSEALDILHKTPGPMDKPTFKGLPGFDFDLTVPFSKTFGIVVTGLVSNQYNEQHRTQTLYNHAQGGATAANPFLQTYTFQDGPKNTFRRSGSIKTDWKVAPGHVISASWQSNYYLSQFGNRNYNFNVNSSTTTFTPNPGTGLPLSYTPTSVNGATGRGTLTGEMSVRDKYGLTNAAVVSYKYTGDRWKVESGANYSKSKTWYRDGGRNHFSSVRTSLIGINRISYEGITEQRPTTIRAYNSANAELDWTNLANFNITQARMNPLDASDEFRGFDLSAERELNTSFYSSIKVGASYRQQERDIRRQDTTWTYNGLNGSTNATAFIDSAYLNQDPHFGLPIVNYVSPYLLWSAWQANPSMFTLSTAQELAAERFRRANSQQLTETITAGYMQMEGRFMQNRLQLIAGARYEKTEDDGLGPKTNGPTSTLALLQANLKERGYKANKSYDNIYPSFHANYNITDNLVARFAYAKTLGRPDFANILPLARVNAEPGAFDDGLGTIPGQTVIVTNAGLEPWEADGYDFTLAYYFAKSGVISAGYFTKDISNFWGQAAGRTVTAEDLEFFNLDPTALGLALQTTVNVGAAKISGFEVNYRQPLTFLPGFGRNLVVFANGTKLDLSGPNNADFAKFIAESASWGVSYVKKPFVLHLKWNYRGEQSLAPQTGAQYGGNAGGYREYYAPRTFTDVNVEYQVSKRATFFANARNVFNVQQKLLRYNATTPEYAKGYRSEEFGVQISVGVKGTW